MRSPECVLLFFTSLASVMSITSRECPSAADDDTGLGIVLLQTGVARVPAPLPHPVHIGAVARRAADPAAAAPEEAGRAGGGPGLEAAAMRLLDSVYEGHLADPFHIPIDQATASSEILAKTGSVSAAVYGELLPTSVADLLIRQLRVQPGQKYYDLGSGLGKTAAMAYLLGLDATGVELAHERWDASCAALARLRGAAAAAEAGGASGGGAGGRGPGLRYVQASFLDVDFSDADVVFTDSVMFSPEMLAALGRAAGRLRPGALVVSAQGLPGPGLRDVARWTGPTTWSPTSAWTIQRVVRAPGEAAGASQRRSLFAKAARRTTGSAAVPNGTSGAVCAV